MDLLVAWIEMAAFIVFVVLLCVAGWARLRGRRSRFDRVVEVVLHSIRAGVFPPSLRGIPEVPSPSRVPRGRTPRRRLRSPAPDRGDDERAGGPP